MYVYDNSVDTLAIGEKSEIVERLFLYGEFLSNDRTSRVIKIRDAHIAFLHYGKRAHICGLALHTFSTRVGVSAVVLTHSELHC